MKTIALIIGLLIASTPAIAQDDTRWVRRSVWSTCEFWGTCYRLRYERWEARQRQVRVIYRQAPRREREATLHYRTPHQHEHHDHRRHCRDVFRTVGNQHLSVQGAKGEADKAWIQAIRFYHGEIFMSLENARGTKYTCSRSSVGETLGQTFSRCEIEARPCKAEREDGER